MNKYHFTISLNLKCDYDVKSLERQLGLKPYKITPYNESVGLEKSAKFVYRTETLTGFYSDTDFEKFVDNVKNKLQMLPQILDENKGTCIFRIVLMN